MLIKLPLSLLAGAVVTWGVAWGCALSPASRLRFYKVEDQSLRWDHLRESLRPESQGTSFKDASAAHIGAFKEYRYWSCLEYATCESIVAGWPFRALSGHRYVHGGVRNPDKKSVIEVPYFSLLSQSESNRKLPMEVIPVGFTLNTLLAAGVLLTLVEGFAFARRRVQRSKGRCPSCGYDRAGIMTDVACPECGGLA
jgi:hypothetical protein